MPIQRYLYHVLSVRYDNHEGIKTQILWCDIQTEKIVTECLTKKYAKINIDRKRPNGFSTQ